MASFANLSSEERIGLGLAAALHVGLVAALVWQVRDEPARIPAPERIEVSLAEEVSLTSAAPDPAPEAPAAVAPVLSEIPSPPAPEPVPTVAVRPEPRPTVPVVARPTPKPSPKPTAKPSAKPATKPTAKPAPRPSASATRAAGGSRMGTDFLEGTSAGERSTLRGAPAATFGAAEQASLEQAINRELKPNWTAPQGVDAEKLVTILAWELNADGTLKGRPQVVSQSGITDSNRPQAALHAERAIRAVQLAAPFNLPEQFYDKWKRIRSWRFDRRL